MSIMTDALTTLGANLPLVAVGCAEALAAAALAGKALMLRGRSRPGAGLVSSVQDRDIQRTMMLENGEVSIVLRREDMMPLARTGDPEALLGVSFSSLQNDIVNLNAAFHDKYMARRAWQRYQDWNGEGMLDETLQLRGGKWMRFLIKRTPDGRFDLLCFRDITALHDRIEDCEKRLAAAEEENCAKTTFLSRMSHEIRTPMNGIIGMVSLAKSRLDRNSEALQYLDKADELSDHLLALINDILDMSRIEAGKVELEKKRSACASWATACTICSQSSFRSAASTTRSTLRT